jgi:hypothetical protein
VESAVAEAAQRSPITESCGWATVRWDFLFCLDAVVGLRSDPPLAPSGWTDVLVQHYRMN